MTDNDCPPGCNVPIWRLEMARRAGSSEQSFPTLYPGLTVESLREGFDYARRHADKITRLIRKYGPGDVPDEPEPDDEEDIMRELEELLDCDDDVYRRLAQ